MTTSDAISQLLLIAVSGSSAPPPRPRVPKPPSMRSGHSVKGVQEPGAVAVHLQLVHHDPGLRARRGGVDRQLAYRWTRRRVRSPRSGRGRPPRRRHLTRSRWSSWTISSSRCGEEEAEDLGDEDRPVVAQRPSPHRIGRSGANRLMCGSYAEEFHRHNPHIKRFEPDRPIPWVRGWSLRDERPVLVPARLVHYSPGRPRRTSSRRAPTAARRQLSGGGGLLRTAGADRARLVRAGLVRPRPARRRSTRPPSGGHRTGRWPTGGAVRLQVHALRRRVDLAIPVVTAVPIRIDGGPGTLAFAAGRPRPGDRDGSALCGDPHPTSRHLPAPVRAPPAETAARWPGTSTRCAAARPSTAVRAAADGRARRSTCWTPGTGTPDQRDLRRGPARRPAPADSTPTTSTVVWGW